MYRDASHLWRSFSHNRTKINIQLLIQTGKAKSCYSGEDNSGAGSADDSSECCSVEGTARAAAEATEIRTAAETSARGPGQGRHRGNHCPHHPHCHPQHLRGRHHHTDNKQQHQSTTGSNQYTENGTSTAQDCHHIHRLVLKLWT